MKKFRFITMALMAMFMASCSNEEIATPEQEAEYVTVNLGVTGEYLDLSDSPLATRTTTTTDTYYVSVYTVDGETQLAYAGGLFTSLQNVNIKLLKGKKYKFKVGIYINDQLSLGGPDINNNTDFYSPNWSNYVNNEFSYGYIGYGSPNACGYEHDFFYGELTDYSPIENGIVEIATKRTPYGAHYIAEGLTEGSLAISVRHSEGCSYQVTLTNSNSEHDGFYCFCLPEFAWQGILDAANGIFANYYETQTLTLNWTKDDGFVVPLGQYSVTFKRNVKTTIRIKVKDKSDISNGIVITREEAPMTNDDKEYVIEVEDGTITEVPVTTTPQ